MVGLHEWMEGNRRGVNGYFGLIWDSLVAQRLKRLTLMWETWVRSLGQEDPLEKETATHSSILAWEIPQTEEPGGLLSMELQESRHDLAIKQQQI